MCLFPCLDMERKEVWWKACLGRRSRTEISHVLVQCPPLYSLTGGRKMWGRRKECELTMVVPLIHVRHNAKNFIGITFVYSLYIT